ncbi:MAG: tetratricopeptide repeat protein [Phycisphaerae bacterium]|nr:tetratricopeptide repeat protein [Phycisphaerae bacterium]
MPARFLVGLVGASLLLAAGCRSLNDGNKPVEQGLVEAPDASPAMTPAELGRRYRALSAEGVRLAGQRQPGLALAAFEQAVALRPESAEALFNLAACYEDMGDPMRAVNIYRRVLQMTPDDADCYRNLGTSFIKMYYRERSPVWRKMAREAWRRSLALRSEQPDVRAFLASTDSVD